MQIKFHHLMLTEYCELHLYIVFEICGTVSLYMVFVTVCEQYGDG